jgi:hypothetical protein
MGESEDIEKILKRARIIHLDVSEKERVWQGVSAHIGAKKVAHGWSVYLIKKPMITGLIVALAVLLGVGGTAAAADGARPGDALFGVDRAVERVRIALANSERKDDLRIQFAEERMEEVNEILTDDSRSGGAVVADAVVEIEADVFTDTTVVKIELNDREIIFRIQVKDREAIIDAVVREFQLDRALVAERLRLEVEDRVSRPEDRLVRRVGVVSDDVKERIRIGMSATVDELVRISDSESVRERVASLLDDLSERVDNLPDDVRVKIDDDRLEIRTEDGRVRIEVRADALVDDKDDGSDRSIVTSVGALQIEANIFTDTTSVKVELNDAKTIFTTSARTRDSIIDEIRNRFSVLTREDIDRALRFETEDRVSQPDDLQTSSAETVDDADDDSSSGKDDSADDNDGLDSGKGSDDSGSGKGDDN